MGPFWSGDELISPPVSARSAPTRWRTGRSGTGGQLRFVSRPQGVIGIYIHINNTNPILLEDSPERRAVESAGLAVAYDGMELDL